MKKKLAPILVVFIFGLLVSIVYATTFSSTYDTNTPLGSDDPAEADDRMREIKSAVQERENVDHYWPLTGTEVSDADTGEHRKVLFHEPISSPGTVAEDHGQVFIKDVNSIAEFHWIDENEEELQFTRYLGNLASPITSINLDAGRLTFDVPLIGMNAAGDTEVDLIKSGRNEADDADVAIVPDGVRTDTDAAPTEDTGVANKKYVDEAVVHSAVNEHVRGWCRASGIATPVVSDSFNVTGVTRPSTGTYTVTWDTNFANTFYAVSATAVTSVSFAVVSTIQVGSVTIKFYDDTGSLNNVAAFTIMTAGDQ